MSICNLQETLLMYTKQKSMINAELSDVMFNMTAAARETTDLQDKYNQKVQYYYSIYEGDTDLADEYEELMEELEKEHEFELANLESWEAELETQKNNYETRLNMITQYESSWEKLLSTNIKNDFSYGGVSQG